MLTTLVYSHLYSAPQMPDLFPQIEGSNYKKTHIYVYVCVFINKYMAICMVLLVNGDLFLLCLVPMNVSSV